MSKLWYESAAIEWEEALPMGNGRVGSMIYGDAYVEKIQVNEESMWYGGPVQRNNQSMKEHLPKVRQLLIDGKIKEAEELMWHTMSGCPNSMHPYQTLGQINIDFTNKKEIREYKRELDLDTSITTISYKQDDIIYQREIFISKPADCMVMKLSANQSGKISFCASLERGKYFDGIEQVGENEIALFGNLGRGGYEFAMNLRAYASGGNVKVLGEHLIVEEADEVMLLFGEIGRAHV